MKTDYRWVLVANEEDDTCYIEKEITPDALMRVLAEEHKQGNVEND